MIVRQAKRQAASRPPRRAIGKSGRYYIGTLPVPAEAFAQVLRVTLPWPGSANSYWTTPFSGPLAGRRVLSTKARQKRAAAVAAMARQDTPRLRLTGALSVVVVTHQPGRRACDLDNVWKPLLDMLVHGNIIADDGYVDVEMMIRGEPSKEGYVVVHVGCVPPSVLGSMEGA